MKTSVRHDELSVRVALIDAVARVYAGGLQASNSAHAPTRRLEAREDVNDFIDKLESLDP